MKSQNPLNKRGGSGGVCGGGCCFHYLYGMYPLWEVRDQIERYVNTTSLQTFK